MPSPWAAFTSAPPRSSSRTSSASPRMAASATGESGGTAAEMSSVRHTRLIFHAAFIGPPSVRALSVP